MIFVRVSDFLGFAYRDCKLTARIQLVVIFSTLRAYEQDGHRLNYRLCLGFLYDECVQVTEAAGRVFLANGCRGVCD